MPRMIIVGIDIDNDGEADSVKVFIDKRSKTVC